LLIVIRIDCIDAHVVVVRAFDDYGIQVKEEAIKRLFYQALIR